MRNSTRRRWAGSRNLYERLGAKLAAVSLAQCVHISASTTWSAFCAEVAADIDALPLPGKFVLVDDNLPTSCGWLLQHRLSGLIMITSSAVFEEEHLRSDSFHEWSTFIASLAQSHRDRDTTFLTNSAVRNACLNVTPKVLKFLEEAMAARDAADWGLAAFMAQSASNADITHEVMNRKPRDPPVPATVVVPAMGAKVAIQISGMILRVLLSNCELEFVLHSKKWWYLEGRNAWVDIVLQSLSVLALRDKLESYFVCVLCSVPEHPTHLLHEDMSLAPVVRGCVFTVCACASCCSCWPLWPCLPCRPCSALLVWHVCGAVSCAAVVCRTAQQMLAFSASLRLVAGTFGYASPLGGRLKMRASCTHKFVVDSTFGCFFGRSVFVGLFEMNLCEMLC